MGCNEHGHGLHWRGWPAIGGILFPARPGRRLEQYRGAIARRCSREPTARSSHRHVVDVGIFCESGASGSVLAPLLMIGAATFESVVQIPAEASVFWAMMGIGWCCRGCWVFR